MQAAISLISSYLPFHDYLHDERKECKKVLGPQPLSVHAAASLDSKCAINKLAMCIQKKYLSQTRTESIFQQQVLKLVPTEQKLALFNNNIHTVQDAIENHQILKKHLGTATANEVSVTLARKFGTMNALPTAAQAQAIVSNLYDPIEEKSKVSKYILDTTIAQVVTIIPPYSKYDSLKNGITQVSNQIAKIKYAEDNFDAPQIRDVVGTMVLNLDDFEKKLASDGTDSAKIQLALFKEARNFIRKYYQTYKQVDSVDMFSYRLGDLGLVKSYPQEIRQALFDSDFHFYFQAVQNFTLLKSYVGELVGQQIITAIEQEEDLALSYKFGSDVTSIFNYELNLESTEHQSWVGYLCYTFADDKVQAYFPKPDQEDYKWLQFFIDHKDAPIYYDVEKTGRLQTSYQSFFKKISAYYVTFGVKDKNKQQRVRINEDTLKLFIQNLLESAEGTAVLMNLRARSQAFYLSKFGNKHGFYVDYTKGNINQFQRYVEMVKYPRLSIKYRNMLKPDPSWFTSTDNQKEFTRFQQDTLLKMLILNPGFNAPDAQNIVLEASLAILINEGFDNGEVYIAKVSENETQQKIFDDTSKKMLKEVIDEFKAALEEGPAEEDEALREKFEKLSELYDGHVTGQGIYSVMQETFNSIVELLNESQRRFLQIAKVIAGFLATAGALGVIIVAICGKGNMSWIEWTNFGAGLALMLESFYGTFVAFKSVVQTIGKWIIDKCSTNFLQYIFNPNTLKFIGQVMSKFASVVVILCTIYFIYANFNTAVRAFNEKDVVTGVLSIVCGVLLIISLHVQILSLLITSSLLSGVGAVVVIISIIIQSIIYAIQDDEITKLLKHISTNYPELVLSSCISV